MSTLLAWLLGAALVIMALSLVGTALRIVFDRDDETRIVLADIVYFSALALFALFMMWRESVVALDVMMIGSLIGILSTVALARLISRGRR
ncbi:monovalent cation/H+ antiporter complex subunit F [Dietzia timorensis]|uniref:Uncharacterized protein n=1 Tax=Dietzia timorensis TaxID=499555 RepID=A0A173LL34_9ACTN|nr:monovalent cation/H+ antiporter complex subunit F [Dietzia timorensis]ANI91310.1 Hypothetical protein BJL86_0505 [Dietzia timorensis]